MKIGQAITKMHYLVALLFILFTHDVWGQAGSTRVTVKVVKKYKGQDASSGEGWNEYRWNFWYNGASTPVCIQKHAKNPGWFDEDDIIADRMYESKVPGYNSSNPPLRIKAESWENDDDNSCTFNGGDDLHFGPDNSTVYDLYDEQPPGTTTESTMRKAYLYNTNERVTYEFFYTPPQPSRPSIPDNPSVVCVNDAITLSTNTYIHPKFHNQVKLYWYYWVVGDYYKGTTNKRWRALSETTPSENGGKKTIQLKNLSQLSGLNARKEVHFQVKSWANNWFGDDSQPLIIDVDPPGPSFYVRSPKASCAAIDNGEIRIYGISGTGKYKYLIHKAGTLDTSSGTITESSKTLINQAPGTYDIQLVNYRNGSAFASACDVTQTVIVKTVNPIQWGSTSFNDPTCPGSSSGSINVEVNEGTSAHPVTFTITGGHYFDQEAYNKGQFKSLPAGSYTVTAEDECSGRKLTKNFTLTAPPTITATVTSTLSTCRASGNGSVTVQVASGPGTYDFELRRSTSIISSKNNTTATSPTFNGLTAGYYEVWVYDYERKCSPLKETIFVGNKPITLGLKDKKDIRCPGDDATISLAASGGSGSYSYTLTHRSQNYAQTNTTGVFVVDRGGTYDATVKGTNTTCSDIRSLNGIYVRELTQFSADITQQNITCSGVYNGKLTTKIYGGTAPYTYQWQERDNASATWYNYTGPGAQTSEIAGLYDAHYQLVVTDQNGCVFTTSEQILTDPDPLSIDEVTVQHVSCQGTDDGRIITTVSGGWGDHIVEYQEESQTTYTPFTDQTTFIPGTYRIRITDREGCTLAYPDMLTITDPTEALTLQSVVSNYGGYEVTCFGGNDGWIEATATGGNSRPFGNQYRFALNEGSFTGQSRFTELTAGTYLLKVQDERGCIVSQSITLSSPDKLTLLTADKNYIRCFGDSTGYITVQAAGGVAPYQYRSGSADWQDSPAFDRLPGGDYSFTVVDAQGCQTLLAERMETNDPLTIAFDKTDVRCYGENNGEITAAIRGGKAPYSLAWKEVSSTEYRIESLPPGWYTLTVTDADACSFTDSVLVEQPQAVLLTTPVATPVRCFGEANGQIALPSDGGTPPYRYSLDGGTTYQPDSVFTGLPTGTYATLTVDSRGCTFTAEATIVEPTLLEVSLANKTDILCRGKATGTISVQAIGGSEPYRYSLNGIDWQQTPDFTDLVAGDYQVQLQDTRGCETTLAVTLIEPNAPLQLTYQVTPVQCKGTTTGAIETTITGGTAPYTYQWKNRSATTSAIRDLPHGDYVLTVTDNHGCQLTHTIAVIEPDMALQGSVSLQRNVSCFGVSDGSVQIEAQGGYPPYRYAWQGETFSDVLAYDNLPEGTYRMVIRDSMDCEVTIETFVSQPDVVATTAEVLQHVSCFGGNDARFQALVTGGTQPYRYSLDTGATWQSESLFAGYPIGHYEILVEDTLGCQASTELDITEPPLLSATIENVVEAACTQANGEAQAVAQGGTLPYRYAWINQQEKIVSEEAYPTNLRANVYDVYVTDANNCRVHLTQIINDLEGPTSQITAWQDARCYTSSDGQATVAAHGGTGAYRYQWDDSLAQTGTSATNLPRGDYFVTVTDERGCVSISSVTIGSPEAFQLDTLHWQAPTCYEACDGQLSIALRGGVTPYTYRWEGRLETTATLQNLCRGGYTLTVTDAEGCTLTQVLTMTPPDSLALTVTDNQPPTCFRGCCLIRGS